MTCFCRSLCLLLVSAMAAPALAQSPNTASLLYHLVENAVTFLP